MSNYTEQLKRLVEQKLSQAAGCRVAVCSLLDPCHHQAATTTIQDAGSNSQHLGRQGEANVEMPKTALPLMAI